MAFSWLTFSLFLERSLRSQKRQREKKKEQRAKGQKYQGLLSPRRNETDNPKPDVEEVLDWVDPETIVRYVVKK
ncbi:hypothetical protein CEN44_03715 [Fischerella muscicola CCMEE 5323]|uniref:Uncharacterized protein n=1 Tax=Fischerella muscicola CCMEE 5323 TaxID=2019572 RepID=A0A2N6K7J7_FISMU|nr:hypothetical protein CEN44_03715 [Fischerella muscicola CCMEE 5323]